jgi:hypothetical protein
VFLDIVLVPLGIGSRREVLGYLILVGSLFHVQKLNKNNSVELRCRKAGKKELI